MKRELHTLYLKHDENFKTLSKMALAQVILKLVFIKKNGASIKQILSETEIVIIGKASRTDVDEALNELIRIKKIHRKNDKYFIHEKYKPEIQRLSSEGDKLFKNIIGKYFNNGETGQGYIEEWFKDVTIKFFENFSFEWFHQVSVKGKNGSNLVTNIHDVLKDSLLSAENIVEADKEWLKVQYCKFLESDEPEENQLFWQFGISMFSARLITARHYADEIALNMFKDSKFILDTNILMILDLEEHNMANSLSVLEKALVDLNINPVYFKYTEEEYVRAMAWRKTEAKRVFSSYSLEVLKESECPFIKTALRRKCRNEDDIERMFDTLLNVPENFNHSLPLQCLDYEEISDAQIEGQQNQVLKDALNKIYRKRSSQDKREKALTHDGGLIAGANYLRKQDEKCWIVTIDSNLKLYAIEHCVRDENEIAVGLDVVVGLLALTSGGTQGQASNFAPLFKNLIRYSLLPENDTYDLRDLAFILSTDTKINQLSNERVIEVAKEFRKLRLKGEPDDKLALFLRRIVEGDKLDLVQNYQEATNRASLERTAREKEKEEKDLFINEYRNRRTGELRDKYDKELFWGRFWVVVVPLAITAMLFIGLRCFAPDSSTLSQFVLSCIVETAIGLGAWFPLNPRLRKRHSEYVNGIERTIESEITNLKKQAGQ